MKNSNNTKAGFSTKMKSLKLAGLFCLFLTVNSIAQQTNKCLAFNGSNSIVSAINNDLGLDYVNNLSVAAWVNWNNKANAGNNSIIATSSDSANTNGQFWLQHNANNSAFQFVIQMDSMVKYTVTGTTNPIAGNWYYVVGVYDGSKIKLYVNGVLEANTTITSGQNLKSYDATLHYTIGANSQNLGHFNGKIDEVSIWSFPLNNAMIQSMMCVKTDTTAKGLVSYYNMDSLATDSLVDLMIVDTNGNIQIGGIENNCSLVNAGAPVGDNSTFLSGSAPFVFVNSTTGDSIRVDSLKHNTNGIYIYQVNSTPVDSSIPTGVSTACTSYYYGIFIPGYNGSSYIVTYYYASTTCAPQRQSNNSTTSLSLVLLDRNAQTSFNWAISNAALSDSKFILVTQGCQNELMVGTAINTTGIANTNHALKVNGISPNPFSSNFMLTINSNKNTSVKANIISMDGKLVSETMFSCSEGENQISFENMNEMASGIYFLNLSDGEGYATTIKIIKN